MESYLEKIKEIEKDSTFVPDSYESFKKRQYMDVDLNDYTKKLIAIEREKLRLKKEQDSR